MFFDMYRCDIAGKYYAFNYDIIGNGSELKLIELEENHFESFIENRITTFETNGKEIDLELDERIGD